jgi:hypothetical protein
MLSEADRKEHSFIYAEADITFLILISSLNLMIY